MDFSIAVTVGTKNELLIPKEEKTGKTLAMSVSEERIIEAIAPQIIYLNKRYFIYHAISKYLNLG
jgi:hypothetical protein